jgi:hypothetical protein
LKFLPPCGYCASPASSPTGKAKGKAKCLWRREEMQKYTPSLLKGKRRAPGQMLLLLLRCVGDQIFSTAASATVGVAKLQMHISFCIALLDLV